MTNLKLFLATAAVAVRSEYVLDSTIGGPEDQFFSHFDFFTGSDPTHGFVDFQPSTSGLASQDDNGVTYLRSDTTPNSGNGGRKAIRLHSKKTWTAGLFILDLAHIPASVCGSWPAWWFNGVGDKPWPATGEIDVIEYVNKDWDNQAHLHTSPGCTMTSRTGVDITGKVLTRDCNQGNGNIGCGVETEYGAGDSLNNAGGGVYILEFNFDQQWPIKMWWFTKTTIPDNILSGKPDTSTWGLPFAMWEIGESCPREYFLPEQMIFDQTFCGDWAGDANVWSQSGCAASTGYSTCVEYVQQHGQDFANAYWAINDIKIYQWNGNQPVPVPTPVPAQCTPLEGDPWATGSFVQCCGGNGNQACLRKSAGWAYRCQSCSQGCPDDKDWSKKCGLGDTGSSAMALVGSLTGRLSKAQLLGQEGTLDVETLPVLPGHWDGYGLVKNESCESNGLESLTTLLKCWEAAIKIFGEEARVEQTSNDSAANGCLVGAVPTTPETLFYNTNPHHPTAKCGGWLDCICAKEEATLL